MKNKITVTIKWSESICKWTRIDFETQQTPALLLVTKAFRSHNCKAAERECVCLASYLLSKALFSWKEITCPNDFFCCNNKKKKKKKLDFW